MASASLTGRRIGVYEVRDLLGSGGMGEVYRARDTRLHRDVAVKVLGPAIAADPDRLSRFQREAQLLAALTHPGIATIHGLEESGSTTAIVMELVTGDTLAERIARGPLPVDEALALARQLAAALDAAHERGIVHRDLKPANIKVAADDTLKVLDFGLARLAVAGDGDVTMLATGVGVIAGTAAYMSPEQARGQAVDKRADIWAFGAVLYEMLTGKQALAHPDWAALPPAVPPGVERALRRCLEPRLQNRLRDIGDLDLLLADTVSATSPARPGAMLVAVALAAAAGVVAGWLIWRPAADDGPRFGFSITPPSGSIWGTAPTEPGPAVSPDGRYVAFIGAAGDDRALWIHDVRSGESMRRERAGDARGNAFWSPDSRRLAFCSGGGFTVIDIAGGPSTQVPGACSGAGSWSAEDVLLFSTEDGGLSQMPLGGGDPRPVTTQEKSREELAHAYPVWLPDGRHFLYLIRSPRPEVRGVYVGSTDPAGPARRRVIADDTRAVYVPGTAARGQVMFVRGATLVVQAFDERTLAATGEPVPVAAGIPVGATVRSGAYDASPRLLVYRPNSELDTRLVWFDRTGRETGLATHETVPQTGLELSADDATLVYERIDRARAQVELWTADLRRGVTQRLIAAGPGMDPAWSPDGSQIAFTATEGGARVSRLSLAHGSSATALLAGHRVAEWSPDGTLIVLRSGLAVPVAGGELVKVLPNVNNIRLSPDMRWAAYSALDSGIREIYLQPFGGGRVTRVSTAGGVEPQWRADGRELYYRERDGGVIAVAVSPGARLSLGRPERLFSAPINPATPSFSNYEVTRDGQRFLIAVPTGGVVPLTARYNWWPVP